MSANAKFYSRFSHDAERRGQHGDVINIAANNWEKRKYTRIEYSGPSLFFFVLFALRTPPCIRCAPFFAVLSLTENDLVPYWSEPIFSFMPRWKMHYFVDISSIAQDSSHSEYISNLFQNPENIQVARAFLEVRKPPVRLVTRSTYFWINQQDSISNVFELLRHSFFIFLVQCRMNSCLCSLNFGNRKQIFHFRWIIYASANKKKSSIGLERLNLEPSHHRSYEKLSVNEWIGTASIMNLPIEWVWVFRIRVEIFLA